MAKLSRNLLLRNIGEAVEHEAKLYDEGKIVKEFTHRDDRVSAGG